MYFYPKWISAEATQALQEAGLKLQGGEMFIPDEEFQVIQDNQIVLREVHLTKHLKTFNGFQGAPEVYSTLEGGMVPTGVDLYQCHICGFWMSRKMTSSDEREHDRQCHPQYEWQLAK